MSAAIHPVFDSFKRVYQKQRAQLVYTRVVNDLDTPVSAYMKIAKGRPYAFLFESVTGGEVRGRYSFMGFSPDLVWRCFGDSSEVARGINSNDFKILDEKPLDAFRAIQAESAFELPEDLPPMAPTSASIGTDGTLQRSKILL